jgi:hypothetical protein
LSCCILCMRNNRSTGLRLLLWSLPGSFPPSGSHPAYTSPPRVPRRPGSAPRPAAPPSRPPRAAPRGSTRAAPAAAGTGRWDVCAYVYQRQRVNVSVNGGGGGVGPCTVIHSQLQREGFDSFRLSERLGEIGRDRFCVLTREVTRTGLCTRLGSRSGERKLHSQWRGRRGTARASRWGTLAETRAAGGGSWAAACARRPDGPRRHSEARSSVGWE